MGLNNGNGNSNSGPLVFLTPRAKNKEGEKLDRLYFSVGRVGADDKIAQTNETPSSVKGDLISVQIKDRTFKKGAIEEVSREVSLYIRDNDPITAENPGPRETYRLPLNFSIPSCGLFNALASLVDSGHFKGLEIDYYRNKKGYETYGIKQNGEQVKWKYELDEIPKGDPILDKKGKLIKNDYSERDAFFEAEIAKIAAVVNKTKASEAVDENAAEGAESAEPPAKSVTASKTTRPAAKPATKPASAPTAESVEDPDAVPF